VARAGEIQLGRSINQSELPKPELNPLLNPRLAENMGRWAEVYFTAPPEKREEAVLDLLRELESPNGSANTAAQSAVDLRPAESRAPQHAFGSELAAAVPAAAVEPVPIVRCRTCGHDNPQSHQFCGMCGIGLDTNVAPFDNVSHDNGKRVSGGNGLDAYHDAYHHDSGERELPGTREDAAYREPAPESDELTLFRSISGGSYNEKIDWTDESNASGNYRGYVGVALAVILLSLGYLFWRSSQASQSAHPVPAAPPVATPEASAPAPTNTPTAETPSPTAAASPTDTSPARTNGPAVNPAETKTAESSVGKTPVRKDPFTEPAATAEKMPTGNGGEELATAERYLNGGNGQGRDSAEAAKWLWKSVAKHNSAASLQLADLYLKGDGVSKNCDQARVLLDAAALKGIPGAGERLRHLPAFGCQ
jgi:hypothetical protein